MKYPGFIGGAYQSISPNADAEECTNLYVETIEAAAAKANPETGIFGQRSTGKSPAALIGTPGAVLFTTLATTPVRGLWAGENRLFAVGGSKLVEITSAGVITVRGDVGNDATNSPAQIFPNGNQIGIISAGNFYIDNGAGPVQATFTLGRGTATTTGTTAVAWVSGDTFSAAMVGLNLVLGGTGYSGGTAYVISAFVDAKNLTLATAPPAGAGTVFNVPSAGGNVTAATGAFLDGYFIVARPSSKQFNISALNDGTKWLDLDFGVKQGYPDNISAILADHEELWLNGLQTTEVWRNEGTSGFPMVRDLGGFTHQGCAAPSTLVRLLNGVAWIGGDERGTAVAWRCQGFQPVRISTHALEQVWSRYSTISDAVGYAYEEDGHQFWVISFLTANATWVYDATTGLWHRRGWWNGATLDKQRSRCHTFVFGKHFGGDHTTGAIYQLANTLYDDAGTTIRRIRAAPHVSDSNDWSFFSRFRLDVENTGAVNPSLDWSVDAGKTYNTPRTTGSQAGSGALAIYDFRRLGRSRDRVFRITITAAVRIAIIDAYINLQKGSGA